MMKRSQRMQPVIELARRKEQEVLRRCGQAQQRIDEALGKLSQLQDYAAEYRQRGSGAVVLDLVQLQSSRHFLERLGHAMTQQQAEVERLHRAAAVLRQEWVQARRYRESLDDLAARYRQEEQVAQERAAQHQADDLSGQRLTWIRHDAAAQLALAGEH